MNIKFLAALASACFISSSAFAADPKPLDLSVQVKALNGEPIPSCEGGKTDCGKYMTVAEAAVFALLNAPSEGPQQPKGEEKMHRFILASKIQKDPHVILVAEDVKMIKDTVSIMFGPLVVGRVYQVIDPGEAAKK